MSNQLDISDYTEYFLPTEDGVLVDPEIFKDRKRLGNKIWDLLKLMSGSGHADDVSEFEKMPDDAYLLRKQFDAIRNKLFKIVSERDGEICQYCVTTQDLTVDHILALSRGGTNHPANLQILCRSHNSQKGAR